MNHTWCKSHKCCITDHLLFMGCRIFSSFWIDIWVPMSAERFCLHTLKRALLQKCTIENTLRHQMQSFWRGWVSAQATEPGRKKLNYMFRTSLPAVTLSEETTLENLPHSSIWSLDLPFSSWKKLVETRVQGNISKDIHWLLRTNISESKSLTHLIWCEFPQDLCTAVQSPPPHRYCSIPSGKLKKLHFESSMFIPQYLWWDKFSWGPLKWWTCHSSAHWCTPAFLWTLQQAESTCPGTQHKAYTAFLMSHELLVLSSPSGIFLPLRGTLCNPSSQRGIVWRWLHGSLTVLLSPKWMSREFTGVEDVEGSASAKA